MLRPFPTPLIAFCLACSQLLASAQNCPPIPLTFDVGPQQEPSTESWSLLERRNGELYRATEIDCRIFVPPGFIPSEFRTDAFSQRWDWVERWMSEEQVVTEGLSLRWALASSEVGQPDVLISHDGCELGNHLVPLDPDTVFVHPCGLKLRCATSAAAAFEGGAIEELGALDSQVNRNWPGNDRVSGAVMDVLAMVTWNLTDSLRDLRQNWKAK